MIITLTANPSHDRTVALGAPLQPGEVQRAESTTTQAGGKGTNISRGALAAGVATTAVVPARADDPYVASLAADGIACHPVPHPGSPRVNVTLSDPDGVTTKINSPGPTLDPATYDALAQAVLDEAATARWVVLAGSLPPGVPVGWYADLVLALRATPAAVAVDTSDAPLRRLVERLRADRRCAPDLLKPNGEELASLTGHDAGAVEADPLLAVEAARRLVDDGVTAVLATLGAHGAVLVDAHGAWLATPPPTTVVSTVGAGDSSLCGYLLADLEGLPADGRLARAVAYGSAAAGLPGTGIPRPDQARPDRVAVRPVDTAAIA